MDKLTSRPSGGGGKLCTLDMQSYLEVMGRQLAEIQAQHQQFCASRPDRFGRAAALRNQDHGQSMQLEDSVLSEASLSKHLGGQTPCASEGQGQSQLAHSQARSPTVCDSSGTSCRDGDSGGGQGGARRLLSFTDDPVGQQSAAVRRKSAGRPMATEDHSPACTTDSSPVGPYTVFEVSGGSALYGSPEQRGVESPLAVAVSSSSQVTWRSSGPDNGEASPNPKPSETADAMTPSTTVAASNPALSVDEESVSDSPCPLAIAGRAYDGIDSEEDDDPVPLSVGHGSNAAASVSLRERREQSSLRRQHAGADAADYSGATAGKQSAVWCGESSRSPGLYAAPQNALRNATRGPLPALGSVDRVPLVTASIGTEEALRLLLSTPRLASSAIRASVDAEGPEVPDDVLAALASTDGLGLDAVLGSARTPVAQPPGASPLGAASASGRSATPGHGNGGHAPPSAHGRHPGLGPGALTAAPAAAPAGISGRGYETSRRSGGHATGRVPSATGLPPRGSPLQHRNGRQQHMPVDASIDIDHVDILSQTIEVEAGSLSDAQLRGSMAIAAAAMAAQRAAAQQHSRPVLYSRSPLAAAGCNSSDGGDICPTEGGSVTAGEADEVPSARQPEDEQAVGAPIGDSANPAGAAATPGGGGRPASRLATANASFKEQAAGHAEPSSPANPLLGRALGHALANVPPGSALHGNSACASPSVLSIARQAADGDMVLYGSPSRKDMNAEAMSPTSVAASPYVPPSPPPGADPSPYMASPILSHPVIRMQRSSRNEVEGVDAKGAYMGKNDSHEVPAAESRFGLAAVGSGRQTTNSVGNSGSYDLSLVQAAAATGGSSKQLASYISHALAGTGSFSRPPPPQAAAQLQAPLLEQHEGVQQPVYSSFSVAGLSPCARGTSLMSSHDLGVDDAGHTMSPSPSGAGTMTATAPVAQVGAVAPSEDVSRGSRHQHQAGGPPLAAFSRAAALAAAADVGLAALPLDVNRRVQSAVPSATHAVTDRRVQSAASGTPPPACHPQLTAGVQRRQGGGWALDGMHADEAGRSGRAQTEQLHARGQGGGYASSAADPFAGSSHAHPQPTQLGQSPAPASATAKLNQLKVRRQQQWQSQHSFHSHAADQPQGADRQNRHNSTGSAWADVPTGRPAAGDTVGVHSAAGSGALSHQVPHQAAADATPMLPDGLAEAISRASRAGGKLTASGEFSLGHGISGLSVAIEEGQVKWAWQTNPKGQAEKVSTTAASGAREASDESPWASPIADKGAARDSDSEWAGLPPPQWQRRGKVPAGAGPGGHTELAEPSMSTEPRQVQQQRPQSETYAAQRRHSEYNLPPGPGHQLPVAADSAQQFKYATTTGGSAALLQPQQDLRSVISADVAGQASSKAAALLRLKRQSIMRHTALAGGGKESDGHTTPRQMPTPRQVPAAPQTEQSRPNSAIQHPRKAPVPALDLPCAQLTDGGAGRGVPKPSEQQPDEGEAGRHDEDGPHVPPKPFLRRRSAKVQARKVDWSHVRPRTNSRNPDYYAEQPSPRGHEPMVKQHVSPMVTPRGAAAKVPLNVNVGARAWKPGGKQPQSPSEQEKAAMAAAAARRRISNIPAAPSYAAAHQAAVGAPDGTRPRNASGPTRGAGGGINPLDDLLAHVNTLLRDFDKIVL